MNIQMPEPNSRPENIVVRKKDEDKEEKRHLLIILGAVLLMVCCVSGLFVRYLNEPEPLPDIIPLPVDINYAPHYVYSIYGVDRPVGVGVAPQANRIYVAETGGERLVKMFRPDGDPLGSFAPPRTTPPKRAPVYIDTDSNGRVFVTDRIQHAVFVYDQTGRYIDTILGPDLTLSEYVYKHVKNLQDGAAFSYDLFEPVVYYQREGQEEMRLPAPDPIKWSPLGVRIDASGRIFLSDVAREGFNVIREIPADVALSASWQEFNPPETMFGAYGQDNGQFLFPNTAVVDSQGRVFVTDGNNGRISVWDGKGTFLFHFGQGSGDGSLSLPRGAAIDAKDRLHVVDAVGQDVKVYDVSGDQPSFLYAFGEWGAGDGQFDYPGDIALDNSGRLFIADRENNRVQVWSY